MAFERKAQHIAVKPKARLGVGDADGGMIKPFGLARWNLGLVPARIPFFRRELEQLQRVSVGIFELEGLNASGRWIPIRQCLRGTGDHPEPIRSHRLDLSRQVVAHQADVLEPAVVAAPGIGIGSAGPSWPSPDLQGLFPKPQDPALQPGGLGPLKQRRQLRPGEHIARSTNKTKPGLIPSNSGLSRH